MACPDALCTDGTDIDLSGTYFDDCHLSKKFNMGWPDTPGYYPAFFAKIKCVKVRQRRDERGRGIARGRSWKQERKTKNAARDKKCGPKMSEEWEQFWPRICNLRE